MKKFIAMLSIPVVAALVTYNLAGVSHCMVELAKFAGRVLYTAASI
jgi:hypothetical protein